MLESEIERRVCQYWHRLGFIEKKLEGHGKGWPDRLLVGVFPLIAFVEFKRDETESLEASQDRRAEELKHRCFPTFTVASLGGGVEVADRLLKLGAYEAARAKDFSGSAGTLGRFVEGALEAQRKGACP